MSNFKKILERYASLSSESRGKEFEHHCKLFLENDPRYKAQLKKVWLWNDWPDNWGRDKGIDLVAQTHNGEIWAIQAKAYDESYYITKEDVDKFLSESSRKQISYRLLIATTDRIGSNALEVIRGQEKQTGTCLLYDLESSSLDWVELLSSTKKVTIKEPKKPRPHQLEAIKNVLSGFEKSHKGQLHMACGTGKTLVGLWVAKELKSHNTLVLVPSISLVSQLYIEWVENGGDFSFDPIFVCSDITVSKKDDDSDQVLMQSSEIGFPVTTNVEEFLTKFKTNSTRPKVVFSTYHSSPVIAQACKLNPDLIFDITISDEAHRCAGPAKSDFATIVHEHTIRTSRKLFMTATPKIFSNNVKQKTQEAAYEIVSMDDEHSFGPVFHKYVFSDAIADGRLTDYQVLISVMDNATFKEYAEKGRFVTFDNNETDARTLASQLLVAKAIKKFDLKKIITFHSRKKSAQEFIKTFEPAMSLLSSDDKPVLPYSETIFGEMQQSERRNIIKKFGELTSEEVGLIANVKCLSEGVDVPSLDGVVFVDPKGSEIDIVQCVGRAIRNATGKNLGTIIIPIFVDSASDEIIDLEKSCFQVIWKVIKALRAHDDVLAEELDNIRLELGKRTYKNPPKLSKIIIDVPIGIGVEFGQALNLKIVESGSSSWSYQFGILQEFRLLNPDRWPTAIEEFPIGNNLGTWCTTQRQDFKDGIMRPERKMLLDSINFIWILLSAKWDIQFEFLKQFRQLNPNRWPEKREYFPAGNKLGAWCLYQRQRFSQGKLEQEKINKLNDIAFPWDPLKDDWDVQFAYLKEFRRINPNRWPIPKEEFPAGNLLGIWCSQKRQAYRKGNLAAWKIDTLNSIGFVWSKWQDEWLEQFNILKEYRLIYPTKWPEQRESFPQGNKLGVWCHTQRKAYRESKLDELKIKDLDNIGFVWDPLKQDWHRQYALLKEFRLIYPDRWPSLREMFPVNNSLGSWCSNQRQDSRQGCLEEWKFKLLNDLGFIWNHLRADWDRQFNNLNDYRFLYPNKWPNATEEFSEKNKLGFWCGTQRKYFKKNKISLERKEKLDGIGFSWSVK